MFAEEPTVRVIAAIIKDTVIAGIIGYAWFLGRISSEVAIPILLALLGKDVLGRSTQAPSNTGTPK